MRIYLDNCCLQRPLDDQDQPRIEAETEAIIEILDQCETGKLTLVSSESLEFEIGEIQDASRLAACLGILRVAQENVETDASIQRRAAEFEAAGLKQFDALHLASAETGEVDFFCTCDDRFLKKALRISSLKLKPISALDLVKEVRNEYNT